MNNISLQDAVHKNIILWNLMCKLDFWKAKISYDINHRVKVLSLGRPTDGEFGHWCKQFNFDNILAPKSLPKRSSSSTRRVNKT